MIYKFIHINPLHRTFTRYTPVAALIKSIKHSGELSLRDCLQLWGASALDGQSILKKRAFHLQLDFGKQKKS